MNLDGYKSPFASLGILGGSSAVVMGIAQVVGWAISPADAADLTEAVKGLGVSIAGIIAVYGRLRASKRIAMSG